MLFWLEFRHLERNSKRGGETEKERLAEMTNNDTLYPSGGLQNVLKFIGLRHMF